MDTKYFQQQGYLRSTDFSLEYYPLTQGEYSIEVFILDGINAHPQLIETLIYLCASPDPTGGFEDQLAISIPMVIFLTTIPGTSLLFTKRGLVQKIVKATKKAIPKLSK